MMDMHGAKGCFVLKYRKDGATLYQTAIYKDDNKKDYIRHSHLGIKGVIAIDHYEFTANDVVNDGIVVEYDSNNEDENRCEYFTMLDAARAYITIHGECCNIYWCRKTV